MLLCRISRWLMRTMAASAAASSRRTSGPGTASPKPWASRNGVIHSKPHSSGRTMRFSSRIVSRVSQSYIQRAYLLLSMVSFQFYQRATLKDSPGAASDPPPRREPPRAQQRGQQNDPLGDGAIEAPHHQNILLDVAEIQRKGEPSHRRNRQQP